MKYAPEYHDKIVVGLPYYGHQWETASGSAHSAVTGDCTTLIYSTLADRAATYGRQWDTESLTPWYAYYTSGWNQGWYDDDESLELKYDLIRQADFQGAGIWALGYDGSRDELWNSLEESFTGDVWSDSLTDNLESSCTVHGPPQYWRNVTQGGLYYGYFYTYSISVGPEVNWIEWNLQLPDSSGSYMLEVWLPGGGEAAVDYRIVTGSGVDTVTVDQSLYSDEWVSLGGPWNASGGLSVEVGDLTGASGDKIVAEAVRFCPPTGISSPGGSTVTEGLSVAGANPSSRFQLLLPSTAGDGVLTIYDCSGRAVHRIYVDEGSARTVMWPEATAVPEGLYTAVFSSHRGSMMKKLLMVY